MTFSVLHSFVLFCFLLKVLAVRRPHLCLANNPPLGAYLDRYGPRIHNDSMPFEPIFMNTRLCWLIATSNSNLQLVEVCSVKVRPALQPRPLADSSAGWEANPVKTLPTRTHLVPPPPLACLARARSLVRLQ